MSTNIEARALANILKERYNHDPADTQTLIELEHMRAAEARAGGRLITNYIAELDRGIQSGRYGEHLRGILWRIDGTGEPSSEAVRTLWKNVLSPSDSPDDSGRVSTARAAESIANGSESRTYMEHSHPMVYLPHAEDMVGWPIYRAGVIAQLRDTIDATGQSTMRGLTSEQLDQLDALGDRLVQDRPQVYVNVSGGVAEATVTRGDVEVIEHDWDNLNDGNAMDYDPEDLLAMREKLSAVADPKYRDRLVADMDEAIAINKQDDPDRWEDVD
jgi:hypothetical protein